MLKRVEPQAYALMRVILGFLFTFHGLQKIFGLVGGHAQGLASMAGVGGLLEVIGGPFIALGLLVSPTAFILSGEMAVAYFRSHQPRGLWPIQNGGELAVVYCFVFLWMSARGAGVCSLDGMRGGQK